MEDSKKKGYAWAIMAGANAAMAAVCSKYFDSQLKFALVILFNVVMWGCYVSSLKALPSLQATVTNFAINFLCSGMAGFLLFDETVSLQWFAGATLIIVGVIIISKSSVEEKIHDD